MLHIDPRHVEPDVTPELIAAQAARASLADSIAVERSGPGSDFLGWLDPGRIVADYEIAEIQALANDLRTISDTLVVVGIGGSYLGSRAVIEALAAPDAPRVLFAGQNLSARHHRDLLDGLESREVVCNVVSKSGTTTEPAVAFRLMKSYLEQRYGAEGCVHRIVATTDRVRGALRQLADGAGYRTLPIADDIGGRYSVLSPVGLLPIAYAGIDIAELRRGAIECAEAANESRLENNPIRWYAVVRNLLAQRGIAIEALASFEPRLHYLLEWWKQLYGESEGKNGMGLYPSSVEYTADLHSMGQYFQQGRRILMETFLIIDAEEPDIRVPAGDDRDELGYLTGRTMSEINAAAHAATASAHRDGGVPNLTIHIPRLDAYHLGALLYFFERACAVSGYLMGINPFDQPGVEAYKANMFRLLGKPGYPSVERFAASEATSARVHFEQR
jgi:glucose-6-phosphate isomerase